MDWGMKNRLSRIIKPDTGKTVMLAVDHGYFLGPTRKLENARATIKPLLPYADCLMVTRGLVRTCVDPSTSTAIMLRVSGGPSVIGPTLADESITTAFEDALRINAAGVTASIFVGTPHERQTITGLAELVNQGERYGMPVMAVTAVGKELEARTARFLGLASRMAAEMGAHMVKTYYCEDFGKVVESCPVPIVIAGGPKLETEMDVFEMVFNAVALGAVGCDMGRNIWQHDFPIPMITSIRKIVHERYTAREAAEHFAAATAKARKATAPAKAAAKGRSTKASKPNPTGKGKRSRN